MKKTLLSICLIAPLCVLVLTAGSNPTRLTTVASTDSVWTNDSGYVWLSGQPHPSEIPGPSLFFTERGELLQGTNVFQDVNLNDGRYHALQATTMVDSNEPPSIVLNLTATDSENYGFYSFLNNLVVADKDHGYSMIDMGSATTNGGWDEFTIFIDPSGYAGGSYILLQQSGTTLFKADHGKVTVANHYSVGDNVGVTTNIQVGTVHLQFSGGILTGVY